MNIERRVYNMIKKYDTCNPFLLAKELKINVDYYDLPPTIRGCYTKVLRKKHIGLSKSLSEPGIKVTLAHELGHAKLHWRGTFNCSIVAPRQIIKYRPELEANIFTLHLLSYSSEFDIDMVKKFLKKRHPTCEHAHTILKEIIDFGSI